MGCCCYCCLHIARTLDICMQICVALIEFFFSSCVLWCSSILLTDSRVQLRCDMRFSLIIVNFVFGWSCENSSSPFSSFSLSSLYVFFSSVGREAYEYTHTHTQYFPRSCAAHFHSRFFDVTIITLLKIPYSFCVCIEQKKRLRSTNKKNVLFSSRFSNSF